MATHNHIDIVISEFSTQAPHLWSGGVPARLKEVISQLDIAPTDSVIDIAAGSGRVSRAIAPFVQTVTAVEVTAAMLNQGREMAQQEGLFNIDFRLGRAEALEFEDGAFDAAICRYAFHHFVDVHCVLQEMARVVRPNGRVIVIDILSPANKELADSYNHYQTLRDQSHVSSPALLELQELYGACGLTVTSCHVEETTQKLADWMNLPSITEEAQEKIGRAIHNELAGKGSTGLRPFIEEDSIQFQEQVVTIVGQKR